MAALTIKVTVNATVTLALAVKWQQQQKQREAASAAYFLSIALFTSIFIDDARHRTSGTAKNYEVSIETRTPHTHTHTQEIRDVLEKRR